MKISSILLMISLLTLGSLLEAQDYFPMHVGYKWAYNAYNDAGVLVGTDTNVCENIIVSGDTTFYNFNSYLDSLSGGQSVEPAIYYNGIQDTNNIYLSSEDEDYFMFKHQFVPNVTNTPYGFGPILITPYFIGDYMIGANTFKNCFWLKWSSSDSSGFIVAPNVGVIASINDGVTIRELKATTFSYNTEIVPSPCTGNMADEIGAVWLTPTTGYLDCNYFQFTTISDPNIENEAFDGTEFEASPLSVEQPSISYSGGSNWKITFDTPVTGLRLYARSWRQYDYIFNHAFSVLSGSGFTVSSDTLTVSDTWGNGIIEFPGTITELTVKTDQPCCSAQGLTFGLASTCANTTSTIDTTVCGSYTSPSGVYTWTVSDTYTDTIPNSSGCDSIITINLSIDCASGIANVSETLIKVYPNPASNAVFVASRVGSAIRVLDITGAIIHEQLSMQGTTELDYNFISGVYFVQVSNGSEIYTKKLIVK